MAKARWYRGNIHTHTTESDGDAEPAKVVSWFRWTPSSGQRE